MNAPRPGDDPDLRLIRTSRARHVSRLLRSNGRFLIWSSWVTPCP
jgi:hypothetical protein